MLVTCTCKVKTIIGKTTIEFAISITESCMQINQLQSPLLANGF